MFQEFSRLDYKKLLDDGLHPNSEGYQKMYEIGELTSYCMTKPGLQATERYWNSWDTDTCGSEGGI